MRQSRTLIPKVGIHQPCSKVLHHHGTPTLKMNFHLKMLIFILLHYPTFLEMCLNIKTLDHKPKHEVTTLMGYIELGPQIGIYRNKLKLVLICSTPI